MVFVVALILSTVLVFVHLSWAMIDPHNVVVRPRRWRNLLKATLASIMLLISPTIVDAELSSIAFALAVGAVIAPAINSPHTTPPQKEPVWLVRKAEDFRIWLGGFVLKSVVALPITFALAHVGIPHAWFFSLSVLALFLNFAKSGAVTKHVREAAVDIHRFDPPLDVPLRVALSRVVRLSFAGSFSFGIWLYLVYTGPFALEKVTLHGWVHAVAGIVAAFIMVLT
jgi:hypothetical protein